MEHIGDSATLHTGDCLDVLPTLDADSIDAVVTDPPYGLSFMGKAWDKGVPSADVWREVLRVLKPGGHLLCFAGTRTQHRMASAIEDAGFEIRDMIAWVYGSGFPKSLDVSKAIDKAAGAEREVVGVDEARKARFGKAFDGSVSDSQIWPQAPRNADITAPATPEAQQWDGWGTALKPALEPITVARKPMTGTVAANVLEWGTGAINVDGCRVGTGDDLSGGTYGGTFGASRNADGTLPKAIGSGDKGRWPANLIHDGSDEVVRLFPVTKSGKLEPHHNRSEQRGVYGKYNGKEWSQSFGGDSGSAARFFYQAKCSKRDRNEGLPEGTTSTHPTVKPTDLMRYLVRLVTPPGGTVLDPYTGSGSTGKAAVLEGFKFIGIELNPEYIEIAHARIKHAHENPDDESDGTMDLFKEVVDDR